MQGDRRFASTKRGSHVAPHSVALHNHPPPLVKERHWVLGGGVLKDCLAKMYSSIMNIAGWSICIVLNVHISATRRAKFLSQFYNSACAVWHNIYSMDC